MKIQTLLSEQTSLRGTGTPEQRRAQYANSRAWRHKIMRDLLAMDNKTLLAEYVDLVTSDNTEYDLSESSYTLIDFARRVLLYRLNTPSSNP